MQFATEEGDRREMEGLARSSSLFQTWQENFAIRQNIHLNHQHSLDFMLAHTVLPSQGHIS